MLGKIIYNNNNFIVYDWLKTESVCQLYKNILKEIYFAITASSVL